MDMEEKEGEKWQSAPRRAWIDTKESSIGNNFKTWLIVGIILAVFTPMITALLTPLNTTRLLNGIYGFIGALLGLGFAILLVYLYHLMRAPCRQRNEARKKVDELVLKSSKISQEHIEQVNVLQKKINEPILQEKQKEHIEKIKEMINGLLTELVIPEISSEIFDIEKTKIRNSLFFNSYKKHLASDELWEDFTNWDIKIVEYLEKRKILKSDIKKAWNIEDTITANSFAVPIFEAVEGKEFQFIVSYGTGQSLTDASHQSLNVNGREVVFGTRLNSDSTYQNLRNDQYSKAILGVAYRKLADEFLNKPIIREIKQSYSDLIELRRQIGYFLLLNLENSNYVKPANYCDVCPANK
jgi:hypothetical protein